MSDPVPVANPHLRWILTHILKTYVQLPDGSWPVDHFVDHAREIATRTHPILKTPIATWGP